MKVLLSKVFGKTELVNSSILSDTDHVSSQDLFTITNQFNPAGPAYVCFCVSDTGPRISVSGREKEYTQVLFLFGINRFIRTTE